MSDQPKSHEPKHLPRYADMTYHQIRCTVCQHPHREAIEESFLHWRRPGDLARDFQVTRNAIYRHANALGLFQRRAGKMRYGLEQIIEQAQDVTPSANDIIRAVRAHACIDENGRWREPRREVVVTYDPPLSQPYCDELTLAIAKSIGTVVKQNSR